MKCYKCKQGGDFKNNCLMWKNNNRYGNHGNGFSAVFMGAHTRCKDWLQDVTDSPEFKAILVANQKAVPVLCKGNVKITTKVGK